MMDLDEDELQLIEEVARKEGRPEVYGDDTLRLVAEIRRLCARQTELLALIANLSQSVPLESEVAGALEQRGALLAEIGTLRAEQAEVRTILERSWRVTKGAPLWEHAARVIDALRFDHEEKCGVVFANLRDARRQLDEVRSELGLDLALERQATHTEILVEIRRLRAERDWWRSRTEEIEREIGCQRR